LGTKQYNSVRGSIGTGLRVSSKGKRIIGMATSKKKNEMEPLAEVFFEGDGIDPKEEKKSILADSRKEKSDHAVYRLASQISVAINVSLQTYNTDHILSGFAVNAVEPASSGNSYRVQVHAIDPAEEYDPQQVKEMLNTLKPRFKEEIAETIHRKKVPDFTFDVLPPHVMAR
jgi:ribosome-binding factor A